VLESRAFWILANSSEHDFDRPVFDDFVKTEVGFVVAESCLMRAA
jgi:hypothetical protein